MQSWKSRKIASSIVLAALAGIAVGFFWHTRHAQQLVVLRAKPFVLGPATTAGQGATVQLYGNGYRENATVWFYQTEAGQPHVYSAHHISAMFPKDVMVPGWYDILVKNSDGRSAILENGVGVRANDGSIPERHFAIRRERGAFSFATEGIPVNTTSENNYDNYPNIDVGVYRATGDPITADDKQFAADHYDFGGAILDNSVKALNHHVTVLGYTILTFLRNEGAQYFTPPAGKTYADIADGQADTNIKKFCAQYNPACDEDDLLQHYQCDCDASGLNAYFVQCPYGIFTDATKTVKKPLSDYCYQTFNCPNYIKDGSWTQVPLRGWNPANAGKSRASGDTFVPNSDCLASTAESPVEARAISTVQVMYPDYWYMPKYNTALMKDFGQWLTDSQALTWMGGPGSAGGVLFDWASLPNNLLPASGLDMTDQYFACFRDPAQCQCTQGQQCSMDFIQESVLNKANSDVWQTYHDVAAAINSEMVNGQSKWGSLIFPGNIIFPPKLYPQDIYANNILNFENDHFVEEYYDGYQNGMNTYMVTCADFKSMHGAMKNSGQNFYLNSYGMKDRTAEKTTPGSIDRGKIMSLAKYYLMQSTHGASGGVTHYSYDSDNTTGHALSLADAAWNKAVEVDMGAPTTTLAGTIDIFGNTNTDGIYNYTSPSGGFICPLTGNDLTTYTNLGSVMYARNYTNGLVLLKERATWGNSDIWSDATGAEYALDGYYHPVLTDGTLGTMVSSVTLRNSEGAILLTNRAPRLERVPDRVGLENQAISFTVTANDPDGDVTTLSAQNTPVGSTFLADGPGRATFRWTPSWTQSGIHSVDFIATDGQATTVQTVTLSITDIDRPPAFDLIGDKIMRVGDTLTFSVTAADPDGDPLTYSASSLPEGAVFQNTTLTWTPTSSQVGRHDNIRFGVSDGKSDVTTTMTITVEQQMQPVGGNNVPVLNVPASLATDENSAVKADVTATDPDGDTIVLSATDMPAGAVFSDLGRGVGSFSWTPTYSQQGAYSIRFAASDGKGQDMKTVIVTVRNLNRGPKLDPIGDKTANINSLLQFPVNATDPDGDAIALEVQNLPTGAAMKVNAFSWKPLQQQIGMHALTFSASDGTAAASETIHIQVKPASGVRTPSGGSQDATNPDGAGGTFPASVNFHAYNTIARTGYTVAVGNVWGDQRDEIITGTGSGQSPLVRIFSNDGKLRGQFYAFPRQLTTGVRVASCDLDGDGREEILAAPGPGYIPQVRILDNAGKQILSKHIWGLDGKYKGGINIACADVNNDGKAEVIIAPSSGTGPQVTIHRADGRRIGNFRAYAANFRGGVTVSAADLNGDGRAEIITAPEQGANPVRFFTFHGKSARKDLWPFGRSFGGGLNVRLGDLDGQGVLELIVVPRSHAQSRVKIFSMVTQRVLHAFLAYPANYSGGVQLGVGDVDGDGADDVITIPAGRTSSLVKLFAMDGQPL